MEKPKKIFLNIHNIQEQLKTFVKTKSDQGYSTIDIWSLTNAIYPLLRAQRVIMTKEIISNKISIADGKISCIVNMRYFLIANDGSSITTESCGIGYNARGKEMNQAMQYALKYMLKDLFLTTAGDKN